MIGNTFKELLRTDVGTVFMNPNEFGESHTVNGKQMNILIDDNELTEREKRMQSNMDGVFKKQTLIYVSAITFGPLPAVGRPITIDGKSFEVVESLNEHGIYSLHLEANRN